MKNEIDSLGILLGYWVYAGQKSTTLRFSSVTNQAGWFECEEIIERYQARTNFNLDNLVHWSSPNCSFSWFTFVGFEIRQRGSLNFWASVY